MNQQENTIIEVKNLKKYFKIKKGFFSGKKEVLKAVDDVSFSVKKGEILGVVGESGSGKTTLARLILRLIKPTSSTVYIKNQDVFNASKAEMKKIRSKVTVVFQDPAASLNPRVTIGASITRPLIINGFDKAEANKIAEDMIEKVKLDKSYLNRYPHQMSGGQLQRVSIARALALNPELIILDEPTSALDISVQAQILNLLLDLQEEFNLTYMLITHDLNVVRYMCDNMAVMYLGRVVELGDVESIFKSPVHPYTKGLLGSAPCLDPRKRNDNKFRMSGEPDSLINLPSGCRLSVRCPYKEENCTKVVPELEDYNENHKVACFRMNELVHKIQ